MGWGVDGECFWIDVICGIVLNRGCAYFVGEAVDHAEELGGKGVAELDVFAEIVAEHCGRSFESFEPAEKLYAGAPERLEADCFSAVDTRCYWLGGELVFRIFKAIRGVCHEPCLEHPLDHVASSEHSPEAADFAC